MYRIYIIMYGRTFFILVQNVFARHTFVHISHSSAEYIAKKITEWLAKLVTIYPFPATLRVLLYIHEGLHCRPLTTAVHVSSVHVLMQAAEEGGEENSNNIKHTHTPHMAEIHAHRKRGEGGGSHNLAIEHAHSITPIRRQRLLSCSSIMGEDTVRIVSIVFTRMYMALCRPNYCAQNCVQQYVEVQQSSQAFTYIHIHVHPYHTSQ